MNKRTVLITGGAGFIGSHLVRYFVQNYPEYSIINLDALTYAGNLANLADIQDKPNYTFVKADINDLDHITSIMQEHGVTDVIHCAAESHVDRSILDPLAFVKTNVIGTVNLLQAARVCKDEGQFNRFYHVSTDEVYGELDDTGYFVESTPYSPRSPYAASKASSDHFVRAYGETYGLEIVLSNCSNNYGPNQFPEKLIPLMIRNVVAEKPLPVYGTGANVRDWLYVVDHVRAMDVIFHQGESGETYNVGGSNEWKNIDVVNVLCDVCDELLGRQAGSAKSLITFVKDRAGHDFRYAIDSSRLQNELGWKPTVTFEEGLRSTIKWYLDNQNWVEEVISGEYMRYYETQYAMR